MYVRLEFKRILLFCSNRPEFVAVYGAKYAVEVTLSVKGLIKVDCQEFTECSFATPLSSLDYF